MKCSLRVYQDGNQLLLRTRVLLCCFRDFFHTNAFSRLRPTDRYDGDAQKRKCSACALHRGAALRLFPCASSFAVLNRIVFALVTIFMSSGSRVSKSAWNLAPFPQCRPLERPFLPSRQALPRGFSSLLCQDGNHVVNEEALADPNTTPTKQLRQFVYLMTSAISQRSVQILLQRSSSRRCRLSRPSTQLPIQRHDPVPCVQVLFRGAAEVPPNFPICSLRSACSETSLRRNADSRFCALSLLDVRCRLKNV